MERKSKGGRPKRKVPAARFVVRVDAELLRKWTESLGAGPNKRRQAVIERMMRTWLENPYEIRSDLAPRRLNAQEREDYVRMKYFGGGEALVIDHKVDIHAEGWVVVEKIAFLKNAKHGESVPSRIYDALESFENRSRERTREIVSRSREEVLAKLSGMPLLEAGMAEIRHGRANSPKFPRLRSYMTGGKGASGHGEKPK